MTAKQYLQQVEKLDKLINNKLRVVESLRELATSVSVSAENEKVLSSGAGDSLGATVAKIVDLQNEINSDIDRFVDLKREIMGVIDKTEYADLLYQRYFQYLKWEQIALNMGVTYQWVCKLHGRALRDVHNLLTDS